MYIITDKLCVHAGNTLYSMIYTSLTLIVHITAVLHPPCFFPQNNYFTGCIDGVELNSVPLPLLTPATPPATCGQPCGPRWGSELPSPPLYKQHSLYTAAVYVPHSSSGLPLHSLTPSNTTETCTIQFICIMCVMVSCAVYNWGIGLISHNYQSHQVGMSVV